MQSPEPPLSPKEIAMAQEREFYKYCQLPQRPGLLERPPISPKSEANHQLEHLPQSSTDTTLTALAQLGALRLNVQRCMISLFDRRTQYILAEATRTLSLQDDRVHLDGDALWLGSSVIPKAEGVCHFVCDETKLNAGKVKESDDHNLVTDRHSAFVIPDLTKDTRFNTRQYVVNAPHLRFYAGVPIRSRRGIAIGAFSVSDGLTRPEGLSPLEIRFMTDTAMAIMNHLEMVRSHEQNRRSANMIAGLGNFVDGGIFPSSSLRRSQSLLDPSVDRVEEEEMPVSMPKGHGNGNGNGVIEEKGHSSTPSRPRRFLKEHRLSFKKDRMSRDKSPAPPESNSNEAPDSESASTPSTPKRNRQNEVTLTSGTREIFGRAARVLRESLDVEGVVFYDASVKSYAGLVRNSDDRPSDGESSSGSSEAHSGSDSENPANGHSSSTETDDFNMSDVLGFSLQDPEQPMGAIRETFLRSLLRNYPQGAIFNIDENGGVSSSEGSDSASSTSVSREIFYRRHEGPKTQRKWKQRKRHRVSLKEENKALMKVFPSARCVTLFPLWDSRRNRWFSGLFVWTKSPRVFSLGGELAYLYAFSNNIMAEIHRLDMELANRAHATLVGSISHELRSPLHGILGSTELLGDSALTPAQTALVNTVEHCGRSLLDIINNMLDFAKINQFTRKSRSSRLKFSRPNRRATVNGNGNGNGPNLKGQPNDGVVNLIGDVQLDAVLEEVADSVFAGHCFSSKASSLAQGATSVPTLNQDGELVMASPTERPLSAFNESLTVVYDVAPDVQWLFETQAGAWRRVLMNLFGNALKYTQSGYIHMSLKSSTPSTAPGNRRLSRCESDREEPATVTLTVKDTGQGIDKEYLQSNVFKPFSQEDPLSPGSGLGLSIVHQTVVSLGGKIDINSTKGVGTEVTVHCDLSRTPKAEVANDDQGRGIVQEAKELVRGKSIGLVGFRTSSEQNDQALELLRSSLERTYQGHFGVKVRFVCPETIGEPCDIYVARQTYMDEADEICRRVTAAVAVAGKSPISPPVIVICSTPQVAQKLSTSASDSQRASRSVHEFISQPCGPSKMANTLRACINRQKEQASHPPAKTNGVPKNNNIIPLSLPAKPLRNGAAVAHADISVSPTKAAASITTSTLDNGAITEISATLEPIPIVPSVLLVDDNTVNLQLLVAVMKKAKFPHFTATNGLEALEVYKAHSREIQVILMDISMPVMDGLESTREIRLFEKLQLQRKDPLKPATIIALSGLGSAPVRQEAFNSGVDLFLSKPVRFQELIRQIDELTK